MLSSRQSEQRLEAQLRRVERLLELVASRLDIPQTEIDAALQVPVSDEVRTLIAQKKTVQAIRLVREQQGLGLAEAKEVVDRAASGR